MSVLRIKCFGKPQIWLDEVPLDQLVSAKAKATVYYLATTRNPASRERLAGLLWSDMPEPAARASLRVVISKLKSQLDRFLIINRHDIALSWELDAKIEIDVAHFADHSPNSMRKAVDAYVGLFLDDFNLRDAPLFIEWVAQERQAYQQKTTQLLRQLAMAEAKEGNVDQAIQDWRKLLNIEPSNEAAHRDLMVLLAKNGQRTAALLQFEQCQQILRDGLDIAPSAETIKVYEQIKASNIEPKQKYEPVSIDKNQDTKKIPNNLQIESLSFIGRESESQKVIELLTSNRCSLLTITGTGGIGKTRLANECGHQLLDYFEDGVYLASLVGTSSAGLLPTSVAAVLDLSVQGQKTPQEQLFQYLSTKNLLLILDNFEHLLEGIGFLTDLMAAAPNVKLLITSREPLGIGSEWVLPLTGLPHAADLEQPAARLFTTRAQRLDLSFIPEKEKADIGRICQLVEGMPLAIELASAWVRVISCHEIAAEIESNIDFLATDLDLVPAHQRSIRAVFAYSWSLLPEEAQQGFAKLAVFRGGFTRQSADDVADVTLRTLTTLVDKSLLRKEAGGRFHIHPLLRQFAFEQLSQSQKENASHAYASYFANLLSSREDEMYTSYDLGLLDDVQAEIENIRAVWDWLAKKPEQDPLAQQMISVTGYYFHRRSLFHEGSQLFEKLLTSNNSWSAECEARFLIQAGSFDWQLGRFNLSEQKLMSAIPILQQADEVGYAADGLFYLGVLNWRKGDFESALEHLRQARAQFLMVGDEKRAAEAESIIGFTKVTQGDYELGKVNIERALKVHQKYGYQRGIGRALNSLGSLYNRQGQYDISIGYYERAIDMVDLVGEKVMTAAALSNLGSACRGLERFDEALNYFQQSLPLTIETGHSRWIATNHNEIGLTYLKMHQYEPAGDHFKKGFDIALSIDAITDALTAVIGLSDIALQQGDSKTAAMWLTFAHNRPELSDHASRQGEQAMATLTKTLSDDDKQLIVSAVQNWSFANLKQSIESAFN